MIVGVGIDAVEIARFTHWHTKSDKQLRRIFSEQEIVYCRSILAKSAERFAARFAAREALLKALSCINQNLSLLQVSKTCTIVGIPPKMNINWMLLDIEQDELNIHLSLSHTRKEAYAVVIVEQLIIAKNIK